MSKIMKVYKRPVYEDIKKRLLSGRKFIQVISGPRQTGKTTLISQLLKDLKIRSTYISADLYEGNGCTWIEKYWETARIKCRQKKGQQHILAIDEIQKIPDWSSVVKKLWDEDTFTRTKIKLIISGSSGLLLQQGLTESLAGRFEMNYLNHWSFMEMHKAFGWTPDQYVWFGGYPGSSELIDDEYRWKRYIADSLVETSISKDILMLTRVDKPALMRRLFDLGCAYSGQILSYTKMLGQLQDAGNTVTLAHYLDLLDSAGLLSGIEKYSGSMIRQRSSSPKFIVRNTALISSRSDETFSKVIRDGERWGRLVESCIGAHLLNNEVEGRYKLYYWRQGNDEIDFVLKRNHKVIGLEIKSGNTFKRSGMDAFARTFKPDKVILVGDKGMPWQEFLNISPGELF
jgi:predicted AAA+ superfamily ATPase